MLDRLAQFLLRRSRRVLVAAVLFVAIAGAIGGPVAGILGDGPDDDFDDHGSQAIVASDQVREASGASASPDMVVLVALPGPASNDAAARRVSAVRAALESDRHVASVRAPDLNRRGDPLVATNGRSVYLTASFRDGVQASDAAMDLKDRLERQPGVRVGGREVAQEQVGTQVQEDLAHAELLAFPLLFLLSLWVFRGLVAALVPLAVGMTTILGTFLAMRLVNAGVTELSIFSLNLIIGLGLGLSIDYSLFVISRFREEMEKSGGDTSRALRVTMMTAGRTVLFSAVTVSAALASLIVFPQRFLFSMGIGGALVALMAAAVSLIVLPALLAALGPRIDSLRVGRARSVTGSGGWYRLSRWVMRRATPVAIGAAVLLIALGIPFTRVDFTGVDASVLPTKHSARVVSDALARDFSSDETSPITIAARAGEKDAEVDRYVARIGSLDGIARARAQRLGDGVWRIDAIAAADPLDQRAKQLVEQIRGLHPPFATAVGGETAEFVDRQASLGDHLPISIAVLALSTLVILFVMTGSVILPVKALVMNLLTISAAFGLLVLIFQDGRLEGLLSYDSMGALDSSQPILLFALVFGLSTDYGVFLLTRIKEARDAGAGETESIALGLERTGRIVTAAALLLVVAIGAFATSEIVFIKELGVGTALAVAIDATIVRALLVPALMRLLGRWNWWAPRPLARLHARIGLSEGTVPASP